MIEAKTLPTEAQAPLTLPGSMPMALHTLDQDRS